jgi:hypothetical protein
VLDMRDIERKQRALLADPYDLHADVRCGSPHVRAIAAGTTFTCALFGRELPADHVDIKVTDSQPQMVAADCGPDRIIVAESNRPIVCTLTYGTTTQTMTVHPLGDQGMRIDLSDRTVTPAPR